MPKFNDCAIFLHVILKNAKKIGFFRNKVYKMNVAIYARVSTQAQAEHGYSLETQVEACKQKAVSLGATAIKTYIDDGYSGAYLERPALDNLRDALAAKLHDTVIIYDTDRLARDTMLLLLITEEIEKTATLVYVNSEYSKTPEGQLFYEIKGSFSKYERIKIKDRFMRGKRGKLRKGLPISDHNVYGYGFKDGNYIINEAQAEIVRLIYRLYTDSLYSQRDIVNYLYEHGIPSPKGKPKWQACVVSTVLRKQQYTGEYFAMQVYHKKVSPKKIERTKRDKSEWIPMTCPAIVTKEQFERAQEKRKKCTQQKIRKTNHEALFQGLLYCPSCGRKLGFHVDARFTPYCYYCCNAVSMKDRSCQNHVMKQEIVDEMVWQIIKKLCRSEKMLRKYIGESTEPITDNVEEKLKKIKSQRETITNWFSANLITAEQATEKLQALQKQEAHLKSLTAPKQKADPGNICQKIKTASADFDDRRKVLLEVIDKIYIIRKDAKGYDFDVNIKFK